MIKPEFEKPKISVFHFDDILSDSGDEFIDFDSDEDNYNLDSIPTELFEQ